MKVMFIVYHDIQTEARTQEILECTKKIGEAYFVSYSTPIDTSNVEVITTERRNYFLFILRAIESISRVKPEVIILHDNYCSILLPWIKRFYKNIVIVYDSSELYIDTTATTLKIMAASFMKYFEKKYLKTADVVISANIERANIMQEYFCLTEVPIVFDNIHKIEDKFDEVACEKKYSSFFDKNSFCIVYGGGIARQRMTYELAEAVGTLGSKFRLIIAGSVTESERKKFSSMLGENDYNNIFYVGFVPRNEWRFLLNRADASVSAFSQDTVNNIYCASGKLYESLFEGTPIITTENPPLKRICEDYGVGISNNNFKESIIELEKNCEEYRVNVKQYVANINIKKRIDVLAEKINCKILTKLDMNNNYKKR